MRLAGWLHQIAGEFEDLSGLPVHLEEAPVEALVSPEIQAQLIRIVQEALSNVRKHAHAGEVWLGCGQTTATWCWRCAMMGRVSPRRISPALPAMACAACASGPS